MRANSAQIGGFDRYLKSLQPHVLSAVLPEIRKQDLATSPASQISEAAQRYASALFDLAGSKGVLADVHAAFDQFTALAAEHEDLSNLMASPLFTREDKVASLTQIATAAGLPPLLTQFLGTMATNGRASEIPGAQTAFDALYAAQRGIQRAVVTTAKPMTEDQRARLEGIVTKAVGRDVEMSEEVDGDLIGGIQLRIGSTLVDASLKAKLDRMNTAMKGA